MGECLTVVFPGHSLSVMAIIQLEVVSRKSLETRGWSNHDKRRSGEPGDALRASPGSGAGYRMFITAATLGVPLASRANNM